MKEKKNRPLFYVKNVSDKDIPIGAILPVFYLEAKDTEITEYDKALLGKLKVVMEEDNQEDESIEYLEKQVMDSAKNVIVSTVWFFTVNPKTNEFIWIDSKLTILYK
jgi:hypothetical protein